MLARVPALRNALAPAIIVAAILVAAFAQVAATYADPQVRILQPSSGAVFFVGDPITLQGSATDAVDGDLSASLEWTSDVDGPLGTGAVVVALLSQGTHTVTASAIDSGGSQASAQIDLTVSPVPAANTPPLVAITAPTEGTTYLAGDVIPFNGTAHDLQEGWLTGGLTWTSDRDGVIGAGGSFIRALTEGTHEITARVSDSDGLEGMAALTVIVVSPSPELAAGESATLQFAAGADAFVDSAAATTNFGSASSLLADAKPIVISYLRFTVTGVGTEEVGQAILRLQVDSAAGSDSNTGGNLHRISDNNWQEATVTYDTRPAVDGPVLATQGAVTVDQVVDFDVTPVVTGDGTYNFALDTRARNAVHYRSREAATGQPELIVRLGPLPTSTTTTSSTTTSSTTTTSTTTTSTTTSTTTTSTTSIPTTSSTTTTSTTSSTTSTSTPTPTTLLFMPTADAFVDSNAPTTNFGPDTRLVVDGSPIQISYLRFTVTGVGTGHVGQAILRLQVDSPSGSESSNGGSVHRISNNTWQEATVTYNTRPAVDGPVLASQGAVTLNQVVDFDVTAAVTGDGTYNFALDNAATNAARYRSRDAAAGQPQLILTLGPPSSTTTTSSTSTTSTTSTTRVTTTSTSVTTTSTTRSTTSTSTTSSTTTTTIQGQIGFQDFGFGPNVDENDNRATAHKPESKLWYNDGLWWATLFDPGNPGHRIHRFDLPLQTWIDTGVLVDDRAHSRQDALWDGQKLYLASHFGHTGGTPQNRLRRYTYVSSMKTYMLDPGFPVNIPGGGTEAMTMAKDSTGALWIAFTLNGNLMVATTQGSDTTWGSPFVVPVSEGTSVDADDIAAVIALPGKIGVFWSNQKTQKDYFAVHTDGTSATASSSWRLEIAGQGGALADDHMNLKLASDGRLFAAVKTNYTSAGQTLVGLLVRSSTGAWSPLYNVTTIDYNPTRPLCMLDEANRKVYVFYSPNESAIYYKTSSMDSITFPTGKGTPFIKSPNTATINNPTGTKQNVGALGLLVVASDPSGRHYWHNILPPGSTTTTIATSTTTTTTSSTTTTTVAGSTLSFLPVADTYVDNSAPTQTFGTDLLLKVDGDPIRFTYLRFTVSGIGTRTVAQGLLRLTTGSTSPAESNSGGSVHRITGTSWSEATTTWDTRPAVDGPALATTGAVTVNQVVNFDVTGAVPADGTYNFALDTASTDAVQYQSREASTGKPQLIIRLAP